MYNFSIRDKRNITARTFLNPSYKNAYIKRLLGKKVNKINKYFRNYKQRKINKINNIKKKIILCKHLKLSDDIIYHIFNSRNLLIIS